MQLFHEATMSLVQFRSEESKNFLTASFFTTHWSFKGRYVPGVQSSLRLAIENIATLNKHCAACEGDISDSIDLANNASSPYLCFQSVNSGVGIGDGAVTKSRTSKISLGSGFWIGHVPTYTG
jgi:hypothetical protein